MIKRRLNLKNIINNEAMKKCIICLFAITFIVMSITAGIVAENIIHTENCEVHDCLQCLIIHISIDFLKNIGCVTVYFFTLIAISFLMQLANKCIVKLKRLTPIELKVIQNK